MVKLIAEIFKEYESITNFFIENADKIAFLKIKKDKRLNEKIQAVGFICSVFESSIQKENFKRAAIYFMALKKIKKEIENNLRKISFPEKLWEYLYEKIRIGAGGRWW